MSAKLKFLDLLGAADEEALKRRIFKQVAQQLSVAGALKVPIYLSKVAAKFQICPQPTFCPFDFDGQLHFDDINHRFQIRLNSCYEATSKLGGQQAARARFTYAHEFAHRFFFIETERGVERALNRILINRAPSNQQGDWRTLYRLEEKICNQLAAHFLVPHDLFLRSLGRMFEVGARRGHIPDLGRIVGDLAREYLVSKACILIRFKQLLGGNTIDLPQSFAFFLISFSSTKGGLRALNRLRIEVAHVPKLDNVELCHFYPGIEVKKFGKDLAQLADDLLSRPRGYATGREETIHLSHSMDSDQSAGRGARFCADWALFHGRKLLVWGYLDGLESPPSKAYSLARDHFAMSVAVASSSTGTSSVTSNRAKYIPLTCPAFRSTE